MTARGLTTVSSIDEQTTSTLTAPDSSLLLIRDSLKRLNERVPTMNEYRAYYEGDQRLVYGSDDFIALFSSHFKDFKDNWCKVVVDAVANRLEIEGLAIDKILNEDSNPDSLTADELSLSIWRILARNNFDEQQDDLWVGALVEGRSYLIVWPDPIMGARVDFNPGQNVYVQYDDERRVITHAVKRWQTPSGAVRVNLYLPDRVEKYKDTSLVGRDVIDATASTTTELIPDSLKDSGFELREVISNPLGEVPVVEFRNREGSEIRDTIAQQDALNYLIVSSLMGAGMAGWPQRVMMTNVNEPVGGWSNHPGRVWKLPHTYDPDGNPIESKIGEFQAADLDKFVNITQEMLRHVASTSFTPMRMFYQSDRGGRGDASSGEALRVDDEGLIDKVERKQDRFGNAAFRAFELVAKADKLRYGKQFPTGEPHWRNPQARHMTILLQDAKLMLDVGFPFDFIVEKVGLSPLEIQRVKEMKEKEDQRKAAEAARQMEQRATSSDPTSSGPSLPAPPSMP